MLRRWRQEIAKHESDTYAYEAPLPPSGGSCHCYRGAGFLRKRRPFGCGRSRCGLCHFEKCYVPKARANKKRAAIAYELEAA